MATSGRECFAGEPDPTAGDLLQFALAALRPSAEPAPSRSTSVSRSAVLELGAFVCFAAALSCGLLALWIYASPMLGAAGALLVVSAALCAIGFAAFAIQRRARDPRASPPPPGPALDSGHDALLAAGSRLFRERPVVALAAALLVGVFLGWAS